MEKKHKKEAKDLMEVESFSIKISVNSRGIETLVCTSDPCDGLEISGAIIRHLRIMGTEPKGLILP